MPRALPSTAVIAALALGASGCINTPRLTPDVRGLGDLPEQRTAPSDEPDARILLSMQEPAEPYEIGPGDRVSVVVSGRPDLGSLVPPPEGGLRASLVRPDGTVTLPFLGAVEVAGRTVPEARELVDRLYAEQVENPQVEVQLASCGSRSVVVEGQVADPGTYFLCDDRHSLYEVLEAAGGLGPEADPGRGVLVRQGAPFRLDYREPWDGIGRVLLQEGDIVHFPDRNERLVYVFGEVREQGIFPIPPNGMELLEVLGRAGGPLSITARMERFYLIRPRSGRSVVYELDLADVLQGPAVALADGDRVFIPPTSLAHWNRWWRQVLPISIYGTSIRTLDN